MQYEHFVDRNPENVHVIHFPYVILRFCRIKYTPEIDDLQKIYIFLMQNEYFVVRNAENIHFPYAIMIFRNIECWKYTFSLCNN